TWTPDEEDAPAKVLELTPLSSPLVREFERAHVNASGAALAGMRDPALSDWRLDHPATTYLAEAAVSSATPYLRAPLLSRISAVQVLHPLAGADDGNCPTCHDPAPCSTAEALRW